VDDLRPRLLDLFGFADFRPGQEEVVRAAVEGRDTLALMPTGSGKSLTYQLAAMLRPEPTLVLSPLIALMKDQVDKLPTEIAATATFVNSSLDPQVTTSRIQDVAAGRTRLLYAAPERLRNAAFVETLRTIGVGLVVIDEVHCVSMWGHDFRPDYLFIRRALEALGDPTVLGMTATATPAAATEIAAALGRDLAVVRTSVVRPNLRYDVEAVGGNEDRLRILVERLRATEEGSAIVYARSRDSCERVARTLRGHGLRMEHYHAGLEAEERSRVQDDFVAGRIRGVVATTAFGMGIDKPDVRFVCLFNYPDSLESYVQMVGRGGRDGAPSETLLLASPSDATAVRRFAVGDIPKPDDLRRVYRAARDLGGTVDPAQIPAGDHDPRVLVGMLEQAGIVRRGYDAGRAMRIELPTIDVGAGAVVDDLLARYAREAEARVERIVRFAESDRCRHLQVAEHFGETLNGPCGACDVCDPPRRRAARSGATPLPADVAGSIVRAVERLTWPIGRRSLVAMLRGSVSAPPSARASLAFGILETASEAEVKRWLKALEAAGAIVEVETDEGYRVLRAVPHATLPSLGPKSGAPVDDSVIERLRSWRLERSRRDGVPAYVVLHDATLRDLAASQPANVHELAAVKGFGPTKIERYGDDILALLLTPSGKITDPLTRIL
jgi:ATP-dependent DNA helicase RecQ